MTNSIIRRAKIEKLFNLSKKAMWPSWMFEDEEEEEDEPIIEESGWPSEGEVEEIASVIMGEARGEGEVGMRAVYSVIKNRARISGKSEIEVIHEPKQFSILKDKTISDLINMFKNSNDPMVKALWELAKDIVREQKVDSTGGSTHYYAIPEGVPYWAKGECWIPGPRIGSHQFGQERSAEMWGTYSSGKRCDPKKPGSFKGM